MELPEIVQSIQNRRLTLTLTFPLTLTNPDSNPDPNHDPNTDPASFGILAMYLDWFCLNLTSNIPKS
jgi:hypothetical protein